MNMLTLAILIILINTVDPDQLASQKPADQYIHLFSTLPVITCYEQYVIA